MVRWPVAKHVVIGYYSVEETEDRYILHLSYFNSSQGTSVRKRNSVWFEKSPGSSTVAAMGSGSFYAFLNLGRDGCILLYSREEDGPREPFRTFYSISQNRSKGVDEAAVAIARLCEK